MTPPLVTFFWRVVSAVYSDAGDMDETTAEMMRQVAGMSIRPAWIKVVGPTELDVYVYEDDGGTANVDLLAAAFGLTSKERPADPDDQDWVATVPIPPLADVLILNGKGAEPE